MTITAYPVVVGGGRAARTAAGRTPRSRRRAGRWIVAALVLYLATLVVTGAVHLPLNTAISAVDPGAPAPVLAGAREAFEGP